MLAKLKKIQTKKLSNAPHTLCELYCYNRCSQTLQHSEKHHSLAMYTYIQPSLQTYKARGNMGSQTQNDIQEKKKCLQYKQVNICWKFQQWIKTTPQMPNWEITHRCLYLFLGVIKNNDKKVCISCPIWVSINIKDTFKLIFNVKPVLKTM